jgi:ABC-type dipeptide/oligopeptide/nickel transport system permease subunit
MPMDYCPTAPPDYDSWGRYLPKAARDKVPSSEVLLSSFPSLLVFFFLLILIFVLSDPFSCR